MSPYRAIYIDTVYTVLDNEALHDPLRAGKRTPPGAFAGGLVGLLSTLAPKFEGEGVVLLSEPAAGACGLPTVPGEPFDPTHIFAEAKRAGWTCHRVSDWSTWYGDDGRAKLHVAIVPLIDTRGDAFPLWTSWQGTGVLDVVARLRLWHEVTGSAYRLTPGASALAIMSALDKERVARNPNDARPCTWKPRQAEPPDDGFEDAWRRETWTAPKPERPQAFIHQYDQNRAYISAAMVAEVAPWSLKRTGRIPFDRRRAGWWLAELAPWQHPHMPDPAGYVIGGDGKPVTLRPITTQRLTLLEELTAEGVYGGVRIIDSWTGAARDYPLRPLAERLRDAYELRPVGASEPVTIFDEGDGVAVREALKIAGHKGFGLFEHADNWCYRPYWWHAIVAQDAVNRWRLVWRIGKTEDRWPAWLEHDQIWYPSDEEDPEKAAPVGLRPRRVTSGPVLDQSGMKLGYYKHKSTRRLKRRA